MKRTLAVMALLGAVGLANAQTIENPILKKLVEKGILKEDEAAAIDEQLAQEEAEKAKYQAEIDKTAMEAKEKLAKREKQGSMSSLLTVKFKKFEIGGKAYLGYTYTTIKRKYTGINDSGDFEVRKFYFDTKAYISDKDYIRFTAKQDKDSGAYKLKIKYAYLYKDISDLIPYTGFEFGVAHTPWYEPVVIIRPWN
jgi:SOS response regulatory protein OraA/RecX